MGKKEEDRIRELELELERAHRDKARMYEETRDKFSLRLTEVEREAEARGVQKGQREEVSRWNHELLPQIDRQHQEHVEGLQKSVAACSRSWTLAFRARRLAARIFERSVTTAAHKTPEAAANFALHAAALFFQLADRELHVTDPKLDPCACQACTKAPEEELFKPSKMFMGTLS